MSVLVENSVDEEKVSIDFVPFLKGFFSFPETGQVLIKLIEHKPLKT